LGGEKKMNNISNGYSLDDNTELRNLIIENPGLPLLVFCGDESYSGEYCYELVEAVRPHIEELICYDDMWMSRDDYFDRLYDDLSDYEEYTNLPDKEYIEKIQDIVNQKDFVKAIVLYVG
jgi:hypothetical protein